MTEAFVARSFRRVPSVERSLSGGRRLVQAVGADAPTQLAGSAPMIWDLLATTSVGTEVVAAMQELYSDAPSVIAQGVDLGLKSLHDAALVVEI